MDITQNGIRGTMGAVLACVGMAAGAGVAKADTVAGDSLGYGMTANLSVLVASFNVAPQGIASGSAPSAYAQQNSVASANLSTLGLASIQAGILEGSAWSDVDGGMGSRTTSGQGRVAGLNTNVGVGLINILSLSASVIEANAAVSGDFGALQTVGGAQLSDVSLKVLGQSLQVHASAAPNTVLFDALGVRVVLNEQVVTGDGSEFSSIAVTAMRITFNNVLAGLSLLNGEIRIGHASASASAIESNIPIVPAPAPAGLAGAGLMLAAARRRR